MCGAGAKRTNPAKCIIFGIGRSLYRTASQRHPPERCVDPILCDERMSWQACVVSQGHPKTAYCTSDRYSVTEFYEKEGVSLANWTETTADIAGTQIVLIKGGAGKPLLVL